MQTITLIRKPAEGKAVHGEISFPIGEKTLTYPTLENADYLIPAGTYPVERTWSPKFKKLLPLIQNVPDREGIRIHMGTAPEHSTGCVLTTFAAMANLQIFFNRMDKINEYRKEDNDEREQTRITIMDGSPA